MERMVAAQLASMGETLGETVGRGPRQQLFWLGLLALPLLFPVALPGMASAVGTLCLWVALGLCRGRSAPLPAWLAQRPLGSRAKALLARVVHRAVALLARLGRPRWLMFSAKSAQRFNALVLGAAGLAMVVPVPVISFDNVLPALAMALMAWGMRLRDGRLLLAGYAVTAAAVASVALLWWGGTLAVAHLLDWMAA